MAADLIVRTERPEYTSGDTVYGAVYLKISGPTCAHGVQIKFFGYETFNYLPDKNALNAEQIQDTKEYVASDQITLYEFQDSIALGQYVFPFQKRLPMDLPGSTCLESPRDSSAEWKVEIVYGVEVSLMGASDIKARQTISITQPSLRMLYMKPETLDGYVETKSFGLRLWLPFVTTNTDVSVCLNSQQFRAGDNLKLKLDIQTDGFVKPKIESILFQLVRDLRITFQKLSAKDSELLGPSLCRTLKRPTSGSDTLRLNEDLNNIDNTLSSEFIYPQGASYVVQYGRLVDIEGTKLINGIQELLVPLKDANGKDLPPTTLGTNIWLMYSLKVTLKFQKNDPVELHLPLCSILPRFQECSDWRRGDWVYDCHVMISDKSPCSVSQEIIESVKFSTLPSFQVV